MKTDCLSQCITIETSDWQEISRLFIKFIPRICDSARTYLQTFKLSHVECLRAYIRPDSGTVFFALEGPKLNYGEFAAITLRQLEVEYYELPDPDVAKDQFKSGHDELVQKIRDLLRKGLTDSEFGAPLRDFLTDSQLRFTSTEYDDLETETEV